MQTNDDLHHAMSQNLALLYAMFAHPSATHYSIWIADREAMENPIGSSGYWHMAHVLSQHQGVNDNQ